MASQAPVINPSPGDEPEPLPDPGDLPGPDAAPVPRDPASAAGRLVERQLERLPEQPQLPPPVDQRAQSGPIEDLRGPLG